MLLTQLPKPVGYVTSLHGANVCRVLLSAIRLHRERVQWTGMTWACWAFRRRALALAGKKLKLLRHHWHLLLLTFLSSGFFFALFIDQVARQTSPFESQQHERVSLDLSSLGLATFVRDLHYSPEFVGTVLRSLFADHNVDHRLPLDVEPDHFLESLSAKDWRGQGLGLELHSGGTMVTLWWSGERWPSSGAALNLLHTAQLVNVSRVRSARITSWVGALPGAKWMTSKQELLLRALSHVPTALCGVVIPALVAPLSGSFVAMPLLEARYGLRTLQFMTGLPGVDYWLSHFFWDYVLLYWLGFSAGVAPMFVYKFLDRSIEFIGT